MTDRALPHRSSEDEVPDEPTDPSTKFGERAAQVTLPVDDRLSIAELQAMAIDPDRSCARCSSTMSIHPDRPEPTAVCDSCAQEIVAEDLPVLLEIASAAQERAHTECSCGAQLGCFPDCMREVAERRLLTALSRVRR